MFTVIAFLSFRALFYRTLTRIRCKNHQQVEGIIMEASQTIHEFFIVYVLLPKLARLELALSPYSVEQTSVNYNLHYIFYFILAVS